jgi:hypothetical protein
MYKSTENSPFILPHFHSCIYLRIPCIVCDDIIEHSFNLPGYSMRNLKLHLMDEIVLWSTCSNLSYMTTLQVICRFAASFLRKHFPLIPNRTFLFILTFLFPSLFMFHILISDSIIYPVSSLTNLVQAFICQHTDGTYNLNSNLWL